MTDPAPRWNPYAILDTDLPTGGSLSDRMAVLESRADLIEGLRVEIDEHEATIRDAKVRRDVAASRLSVALYSADLLRDIEHSIAPLLGMARRTHLPSVTQTASPAPDGLASLIDTLEPVTVTPELEPAPAQVAELSEPDVQPSPEPVTVTNTLDLVFPAGFELTARAVVYLDVLAHPGATLPEITDRTALLGKTVSGMLSRGTTCLDFFRVGTPSQYTLTDSGVGYLRQLHAYAISQAEGVEEGSPEEPAAPEPETQPEPAPAPLTETSEPAITNTLDLVFAAGFELTKRATVFLDIYRHPGTTSSSILARTGFKSGSVGSILNAGMQALQIHREGLPGQYTHTLTPSGVAYLRELHAHALTQAEGQDEQAPAVPPEPEQPAAQAPEPEAAPEPTPGSARPRPEVPAQARKAAAPAARAEKPAVRAQVHNPPLTAELEPVTNLISQEELKARLRENAEAVRAVLGKKPMTELDLRAKLPDMQLSHLRAALGYLEEAGTVRRVPGPTPASRAAYALDALELPAPTLDHLTAEGLMVEAHLAEITDRSGRDTASNMALKLGLPREQVEEALAVLHAQGRLRWSRTGMLLHFTLAPAKADEVAA